MLVSAICPTFNRWKWIPSVIKCFLAQTLEDSELLILDDGDVGPTANVLPIISRSRQARIRYIKLGGGRRTIGEKRNLCCEMAHGEFICHFDNDDWSGPERLADQIAALTNMDVVGYHSVLIWDDTYNRAHIYNRENGEPLWAFAHGATFCYRKSWWQRFPFEDRTGKEDSFFAKCADRRGQFVSKAAGGNIVIRAHAFNTYKPPLSRIATANREDIPAGFFQQIRDYRGATLANPHGLLS